MESLLGLVLNKGGPLLLRRALVALEARQTNGSRLSCHCRYEEANACPSTLVGDHGVERESLALHISKSGGTRIASISFDSLY